VVGQRPEQHAAYNSEGGGVRTYAEGKGKHDEQRECTLTVEEPDCAAKSDADCNHCCTPMSPDSKTRDAALAEFHPKGPRDPPICHAKTDMRRGCVRRFGYTERKFREGLALSVDTQHECDVLKIAMKHLDALSRSVPAGHNKLECAQIGVRDTIGGSVRPEGRHDFGAKFVVIAQIQALDYPFQFQSSVR
jgi:hypothetical protein